MLWADFACAFSRLAKEKVIENNYLRINLFTARWLTEAPESNCGRFWTQVWSISSLLFLFNDQFPLKIKYSVFFYIEIATEN